MLQMVSWPCGRLEITKAYNATILPGPSVPAEIMLERILILHGDRCLQGLEIRKTGDYPKQVSNRGCFDGCSKVILERQIKQGGWKQLTVRLVFEARILGRRIVKNKIEGIIRNYKCSSLLLKSMLPWQVCLHVCFVCGMWDIGGKWMTVGDSEPHFTD